MTDLEVVPEEVPEQPPAQTVMLQPAVATLRME
jgi:hypothetical protein